MRLSSVVESYIAHKRSLGMLFNSDAVLLRAYVKARASSASATSASSPTEGAPPCCHVASPLFRPLP